MDKALIRNSEFVRELHGVLSRIRPRKGERVLILARRLYRARASVMAMWTKNELPSWDNQTDRVRKFWISRARARIARAPVKGK